MNILKGKVAIVTGASRGVGRGAALGLAESDATVYVNYSAQCMKGKFYDCLVKRSLQSKSL